MNTVLLQAKFMQNTAARQVNHTGCLCVPNAAYDMQFTRHQTYAAHGLPDMCSTQAAKKMRFTRRQIYAAHRLSHMCSTQAAK